VPAGAQGEARAEALAGLRGQGRGVGVEVIQETTTEILAVGQNDGVTGKSDGTYLGAGYV